MSDSSSDGSTSDSDSSDAQIRRDSVQPVPKLNLRDNIYSNSDSDDENNVCFLILRIRRDCNEIIKHTKLFSAQIDTAP